MPPLGEKRTKRFHYFTQTTSWSNIGGAADLGAATRDDTASTYARGPTRDLPNSADWLRLYLGSNEGDNITLAAGEKISAAGVRIKVRGLGGITVYTRMYWQIRRRSNAHVLGSRYESYLPSTVVEKQGDYHYRGADGVDWNKATGNPKYPLEADNTAFYIKDYSASSVPLASRIALEEVYFDYIVNRQPTLTNIAVTGETATTMPVLGWDWNDQDGDKQVAYQIKVFTSQQYSAAGFDPTTTAAEFDSGRVAGVVTSVQIPINLRNGQAYRAYVRAAQDLPTRGDWWSDWGFDAFTISLSPPQAPDISVLSYDTSMDRSPLFLQGRNNYLTDNDASFETTVGTWVPDTNVTTMARDTTNPFVGAAAGRATFTGAGVARVKTGVYSAIVGKTYGAGGRSRANATARTFTVEIRYYSDGAGTTQVGSFASAGVVETVGAYTAFQSVSGVAPATTQTMRVFAVWSNGAASEIHEIDAMILVPGGTPADYAPGGLEGATLYEVQYADFARLGNIVAEQISSGGEVNEDAEGFYPNTTADQIGVSSQVVPYHGKLCIRWVPTAGAGVLDIGTRFGDPFPSPYIWAAIPGKVYTHSVRLRLVSGNPTNLTVRIRYLNGNLGTISDFTQVVSVGGSWVEGKPADSTAPAGTVYAMIQIVNGGLTGFPYFVDMPIFGEAGTVATTETSVGRGEFVNWRKFRGLYDEDGKPSLTHVNDFSSAQEVTVSDFEVRPDRIRLYRARAIQVISTEQVASTWSNMVTSYVDQVNWWLKHPTKPWLNLLIHPNTIPLPVTLPTRQGVHEVMGSRYPVVISGKTRAPQFSFDMLISGDTDWNKFLKIIEDGETLLLKGPKRSWYVNLVGDPTSRQYPSTGADPSHNSVPLEFVEVDVP